MNKTIVKNYRLAEIKKRLTKAKQVHVDRYPYDKYVLRPLSFPLSWVFIKLGISANQITVASITVGLIGCSLLATGYYKLALIGSLFINTFPLLDCCDGNVARILAKKASLRGKFLDQIADPIVYLFFFPCVGLGIYFSTDDKFVLFMASLFKFDHSLIPKVLYPFLGAFASSFHILRKYMNLQYFRYLKIQNQDDSKKANGIETENSNHSLPHTFIQRLYIIEDNIFKSGGLLYPLILLAVFLKLSSLYLIIYTFLHISDFLIIFYRRLHHLK